MAFPRAPLALASPRRAPPRPRDPAPPLRGAGGRVVQFSGFAHPHDGAFDQPVGAVDDDPIAVRDAAENVGRGVGRPADLHRFQVDLGVLIHHIDEGALLAILHGDVRHDDLIGQRVHQQVHVDELLRKERVVLVVEDRLQPRGAGGVVDLVVDGHQHPGCQLLRVVAVIRLDRQVRARLATAA